METNIPKETWLMVINSLRLLGDRKIYPIGEHKRQGICDYLYYYLDEELDDLIRLVMMFYRPACTNSINLYLKLFYKEYKYFSNNVTFPIEHPEVSPLRGFMMEKDKWSDEADPEYLKRRLELCHYIADKFETYLKDRKLK